VEYQRLLLTGGPGRWRSLVGTLLLGIAFVVVVPLVVLTAFAATGTSIDTLTDTDDLTPVSLAYLNVAIAAMIPVTWLVVRTLHGLRPGWLSSVVGRIRWGWLALCFLLSFAALLVTVVLSALLPAQGDGSELSGSLNDFTTTTRDFLLVIALLTPLQAAGEEYVFRGYLTQAFGGLTRSPYLAVVAPAVLFALAHGAGQSIPVFIDRLAFGLVAGILVILTGGLEAGIAMHVLNNFLAYGALLAFGDMSTALDPPPGNWWSVVVTVVRSVVYVAIAVGAARAVGLRTRSEPPVLAAPGTRV
jgi:membrane protease YdiL (CAAX protease family)